MDTGWCFLPWNSPKTNKKYDTASL